MNEILGTPTAFMGGLHFIAVGDLFQIKPVCDQWIFNMPSGNMAVVGPNLWRQHMGLYELWRVMHAEHEEVAHIMNRLRENKQTDEDITFVATHFVRAPTNENVPWATNTNAKKRRVECIVQGQNGRECCNLQCTGRGGDHDVG